MSKFITIIVFFAAALTAVGQEVSEAVVVGSVVDPAQARSTGRR